MCEVHAPHAVTAARQGFYDDWMTVLRRSSRRAPTGSPISFQAVEFMGALFRRRDFSRQRRQRRKIVRADMFAAHRRIDYPGFMDKSAAIAALAALAQPTRLDAFGLLVARGSDGVAAGEIGRPGHRRTAAGRSSIAPISTALAREL